MFLFKHLDLKHLPELLIYLKGTVMQTEKALINDYLRVSNVS